MRNLPKILNVCLHVKFAVLTCVFTFVAFAWFWTFLSFFMTIAVVLKAGIFKALAWRFDYVGWWRKKEYSSRWALLKALLDLNWFFGFREIFVDWNSAFQIKAVNPWLIINDNIIRLINEFFKEIFAWINLDDLFDLFLYFDKRVWIHKAVKRWFEVKVFYI